MVDDHGDHLLICPHPNRNLTNHTGLRRKCTTARTALKSSKNPAAFVTGFFLILLIIIKLFVFCRAFSYYSLRHVEFCQLIA